MSKAKRIIAMLITVIMAVSMLSVMSFADIGDNLFTEVYNDPTGTIKNTAILVDGDVASKKVGDRHIAYWDGAYYTFVVGDNVFATYAEAKIAAPINGQVLLGDGSFGEISIDRPMQVFGVNWNVNPNAVDPTDPTKQWTYNTKWDEHSSVVTNVCVRAGGIKNVGIYGVVIQGRFYDIWRKVSSQKTVLTIENVFLKQDASVLSTYYTNTATGRTTTNNGYIFMFYNENACNKAESAKYNCDETIIRNLRIQDNSVVAPCSRLVDEYVSPRMTFEGVFLDSNVLNVSGVMSSVGWWMKFANYANNGNITFNKCCFTGSKIGFEFEGCNKASVGASFAEQVLELNFTNNLFYNAADSYFKIYPDCYSKINISGNYMVKTSAGGTNALIAWLNDNSSTNYTDKFVMRDNTFLGYSGYSFNIGSSDTKVDMTGTYISATARNDGWRSTTSNIVPTGNVRFDYCWYDAARTMSSNTVSDFDVTNATVDKDSFTITAQALAGEEIFAPAVSSSDSDFEYKIYESDASFSNASNYASGKAVASCSLKNYTNYFLFVAMSQDGTRGDVYKMTVTKPVNTDITVNGIIIAQPSDSGNYTITQDGLVFNLAVNREYSETEFILDTIHKVEAFDAKDNSPVTPSTLARYKLSNLEVGNPVTLKFRVSNGTSEEYYYLNVCRELNNKCELISVDNLTVNGTELSANIDGNVTSFSFTPVISTGAECYVWYGSTVIPADLNGMITIDGLTTGKNVFKFVIKAENGIDETIYTITVNKPMSSENELLGVVGASVVNGIYTATSSESTFKVEAVVSNGATYKVFSDPACTKPVDNNTVSVTRDTCVYIVVTSEDGKNVSSPIRVDILKGKPAGGITVEGAEKYEYMHILELEADAKSTTLNIKADNVSYKLYVDIDFTRESTNVITIDQSITYVYAEVKYSDGTSDVEVIVILSERTPVTYNDASSIPAWAKESVDLLNESGLGILKGDDKGNFNAKNNVSRYEIAAIATRLLGVDVTQFKDVKLNFTDKIAPWAENYVKAVVSLGIMSGSNDKNGKLVFNGADTTSRVQVAKIITEIIAYNLGVSFDELYEYESEEIEKLYKTFEDESSIQNWAKKYVKTAVAFEIFEGTVVDGKTYFNPNNAIMRCEIAAVISRCI